jgi:PAS domain S-box-containing protein
MSKKTTIEELERRVKELESEVTESKRTNKVLQEESGFLLAILNNTNLPVYLKDSDYRYIFINRQYESLARVTNKEINGKTDHDIFPKPIADLFRSQDKEVKKCKAVVEFTETIHLADGEHTFITSKFPLNDTDGQIFAIGGVCTDITDHRRTAEALSESEEKFKNLFNYSSDYIFVHDLKGNVVDVNKMVLDQSGYTRDEILKLKVMDLHPPEMFEKAKDAFQKISATGYVKFEISFKKKNGEIFPAEVSSSLIEIDGQKLVQAVARDITERQKLEEALKESEEKYRKIFNNEIDAISIFDIETKKFMDVNNAFLNLYGYTREEALNLRIEDVSAEPDTSKDAIEKAAVTGDALIPRRLHKKKDGSEITVELSAGPFTWKEKKVMFAIVRDITSQVKAAEALAESEERYRTLFENATDVIQIVHPDGQLLFVNSSWCKALGYTQEEAQHLKVFDIIHPENKNECELNFNRALDEGTTGIVETTFRKKDGKKVILLGSANLNDIKGQPAYVHCVFHDMTEHRRMEEELIKMHKLESIGILAGGIAHDFNNILTALTGNLSMARMHAEPGSKVQKNIEEAEKASLRASNLTQQLLTFSKGGEPIKQIVSISEIVNDSCQFVLRGSNVKCEFDLAGDLWLAEVDEGQISQVMHNLVINADHAMPDGGTLTIHAKNVRINSKERPPLKAGDYVVVSVEDRGSGISEKYLNKIFDPYFSTKHRGHGLGLATAYSIIKKHGGLLEVKSKLEKGTVFRFYLPASRKGDIRQASARENIYIGKGSILLMDDEEEIRGIGKEMLEHIGYHVETVSDGRQALQKYIKALQDDTPFDAVIIDLTVPGGMGGKETMKKLLEIDPSSKAIVSSGYANDPIMANYKKYGFSGIVPKPYKIEDMSRVLQSLLH